MAVRRALSARSELGPRRAYLEGSVPNERVWLDGPRASATEIGVRGYHYPPFDVPVPGVIDAYVLVLYVAGRASIRRVIGASEDRCEVDPGDISLHPPLVPSRWAWDRPIDVLHVYIDPALLREIALEELGPAGKMTMLPTLRASDASLVQMGVDLIEELSFPRPFASVRGARVLGERIAIHMLRRYFELAPASDAATMFTIDEIAAIRSFVQARLGDDIRVAEIAREVGLSVHHFFRVFRTTFGQTPFDYLREQRLDRARDLLVTTSKSVSEIALLTGFADQSHLTRCFRRRFDTPPARLRRRERDGLT